MKIKVRVSKEELTRVLSIFIMSRPDLIELKGEEVETEEVNASCFRCNKNLEVDCSLHGEARLNLDTDVVVEKPALEYDYGHCDCRTGGWHNGFHSQYCKQFASKSESCERRQRTFCDIRDHSNCDLKTFPECLCPGHEKREEHRHCYESAVNYEHLNHFSCCVCSYSKPASIEKLHFDYDIPNRLDMLTIQDKLNEVIERVNKGI